MCLLPFTASDLRPGNCPGVPSVCWLLGWDLVADPMNPVAEWIAYQEEIRQAPFMTICPLSDCCRLEVCKVRGKTILVAWIGDDPFPVRSSDLLRETWADSLVLRLSDNPRQYPDNVLKAMKMALTIWTRDLPSYRFSPAGPVYTIK